MFVTKVIIFVYRSRTEVHSSFPSQGKYSDFFFLLCRCLECLVDNNRSDEEGRRHWVAMYFTYNSFTAYRTGKERRRFVYIRLTAISFNATNIFHTAGVVVLDVRLCCESAATTAYLLLCPLHVVVPTAT